MDVGRRIAGWKNGRIPNTAEILSTPRRDFERWGHRIGGIWAGRKNFRLRDGVYVWDLCRPRRIRARRNLRYCWHLRQQGIGILRDSRSRRVIWNGFWWYRGRPRGRKGGIRVYRGFDVRLRVFCGEMNGKGGFAAGNDRVLTNTVWFSAPENTRAGCFRK